MNKKKLSCGPSILTAKNKLYSLLNTLNYKDGPLEFSGDYPKFIEYLKDEIEKITSSSYTTCIVSKYPISKNILYLSECILQLGVISNDVHVKLTLGKLSKTIKNGFVVVFKNYTHLPTIYTNTIYRKKFKSHVCSNLKIPDKNTVVNNLNKYVKLNTLIGTGDWGNVFSSDVKNDEIAIKVSRIKKPDLQTPYAKDSSSWHEVIMLRDIIKPLVENNICPNLPLLIDTFVCNSYNFVLRKNNETHPGVIMLTELASGDLKTILKQPVFKDKEVYSALFQIMAGVHAIQKYGQIMNNDIKASNILYYNINPGGHWKYKIHNKKFYIPNYGKLFVLNDFGVATLYKPSTNLYYKKTSTSFNLGSRFAINIDGEFSPIEAKYNTKNVKWENLEQSSGAVCKIDRKTELVVNPKMSLTYKQKLFLHKKGLTTRTKDKEFYQNPLIIPPFEFYNDTQDTLKIFVGGKRSSQKGNHKKYPCISEEVHNNLKQYIGISEGAKNLHFNKKAYYVLAGEFISHFFSSKVCDYTRKLNCKEIQYYKI